MIWGIHYFITKLKTKIDVIPKSCFNHSCRPIRELFKLIKFTKKAWGQAPKPRAPPLSTDPGSATELAFTSVHDWYLGVLHTTGTILLNI